MSTSTTVDPDQELIDAFYATPIGDPEDEPRALRLAADEFVSQASVRGGSFVTSRHRAHRLMHLEHHGFVVWRRALDGPQATRFVAQAICGQWIVRAARADWHSNQPYCKPCYRVLDSLLPTRPAVVGVDF